MKLAYEPINGTFDATETSRLQVLRHIGFTLCDHRLPGSRTDSGIRSIFCRCSLLTLIL